MTHWKDRHVIVPAVYVLLERDNKVFLMRRANTGFRDGFYGSPSGHVEGRESATEAACREALEEAGVIIKPEQLEFVHAMHYVAEEGDHERVGFYFRVKSWQGEPCNNEPHKCDDVRWVAYDALPKNMVPTMQKAILAVREGVFYSEDFPKE